MKPFAKIATAVALAAGMTFSAQALNITPASLPQYTGNQTSQAQINAAIAPIIGSAVELYKQDVGAGSDSGSLAGSYVTTFSNSASDPADALIDYVGGSIVGATAWLLVKDGNQTPAWYLFNLTLLGWNGTDDLVLTGFWPGNGAISHVALYGTPGGGGNTVPDAGTTMALLGLGLGALGFARRKMS
jgi:hypothetical protein